MCSLLTLCCDVAPQTLPDRAAYPDYFELIKSPISLAEIKKRVQTGECSSWAAFERDVKLMFTNARQYNVQGSLVCLDALKLEEEFKKRVAKAQAAARKRKSEDGRVCILPLHRTRSSLLAALPLCCMFACETGITRCPASACVVDAAEAGAEIAASGEAS